MPDPDLGLITIPEAARRSGLGRHVIERAVAAGLVPVYKVSRWPRVRWNEVERWIDRQRRTNGGK